MEEAAMSDLVIVVIGLLFGLGFGVIAGALWASRVAGRAFGDAIKRELRAGTIDRAVAMRLSELI